MAPVGGISQQGAQAQAHLPLGDSNHPGSVEKIAAADKALVKEGKVVFRKLQGHQLGSGPQPCPRASQLPSSPQRPQTLPCFPDGYPQELLR